MTTHLDARRLFATSRQIQNAAEALSRDRSASPVLCAVWGNFRDQAQRAVHLARYANQDSEECLADVQHAGESAEKVARADPRLRPATRHLLISACAAVHTMLGSHH